MIFELWSYAGTSIEIPAVEFACNLHANAHTKRNHATWSTWRGVVV